MSIYRVALAKGHAAKTGLKVCIVSLYFQLVFQIDHVVSYFCRKILFVCPKIIFFYLFKGSVRVLSPFGVTANLCLSRSCSR